MLILYCWRLLICCGWDYEISSIFIGAKITLISQKNKNEIWIVDMWRHPINFTSFNDCFLVYFTFSQLKYLSKRFSNDKNTKTLKFHWKNIKFTGKDRKYFVKRIDYCSYHADLFQVKAVEFQGFWKIQSAPSQAVHSGKLLQPTTNQKYLNAPMCFVV